MISNPIPWPDGARCAVAITWDLDADSGLNYWNPDRADTLIASQTLTRYGPNISVPRLVELGRRFELKQTVFVPGWCIERYPHAVDLMAENGHELALHGYLHERANELSKDDELYWFERGLDAFKKHLGTAPAGWRAPSFAFSKYSLRYLIDAGFEYDSSLMGDDLPYLLKNHADTLIELPTQWSLDDWPYYIYGRDFNVTTPISPPQRALEVFRSEFDAAWEFGGLWISVWHPFLSGRLARIRAVIELIEYMQAKGGVWFATTGEIADHVKDLVARRAWKPNVEKLPAYESPLPEFIKT
jgi:peptidoglycan-N-acetylglucosamine deacetylase